MNCRKYERMNFFNHINHGVKKNMSILYTHIILRNFSFFLQLQKILTRYSAELISKLPRYCVIVTSF